MRGMGFLVDEVTEWPDDNAMVRNYHVVIVRVREMNGAPMLAARLRAKPHFGRRLLIALVTADTSQADRRAAEASGFDDVMNDCCDSRHLTTRILRGLRTRPELRCVLPPLTQGGRRHESVPAEGGSGNGLERKTDVARTPSATRDISAIRNALVLIPAAGTRTVAAPMAGTPLGGTSNLS